MKVVAVSHLHGELRLLRRTLSRRALKLNHASNNDDDHPY
jgi:hypothetical protein